MSNTERLSWLANAVKPSETLALSAKAGELKAAGRTVYNFTAGQPDFNPPPSVIAAAKKAVDQGFHKYTPVDGLPAVKEAVAQWHQRCYGVTPALDQIVICPGAKPAIDLSLMAIINPGDEVIIPAPYWVSYPTMVAMSGGTSVVVKTRAENGYRVTAAEIAAAITPKTRCILLNSPNNPSGAVARPEEVRAIYELARQADCFVISDDIYCKLVYGDTGFFSMGSLPGWEERVAVINGVSKTYAMTGWRIGWLVGPRNLARAVTRIQGQVVSNPTAVAQVAAAAALNDPEGDAYCEKNNTLFARRRDIMHEMLSAMPGVSCTLPDGAFYILADVRQVLARMGLACDMDLAQLLMERQAVVCVPGSAFGAPDHLRFSFATDEDTIVRGMRAMAEVLTP